MFFFNIGDLLWSVLPASCTEFVYPECWHFDNDATSEIDDDLTEHGGLLHAGLLFLPAETITPARAGETGRNWQKLV